MSQNKNKRRHNKNDKKTKKVIRCKLLNRPVFEHEVCPKFSNKVKSNNQSNCENCKYSF